MDNMADDDDDMNTCLMNIEFATMMRDKLQADGELPKSCAMK
jgi:hypothetical protein